MSATDQQYELAATQQWSSIRQNTDYQRAYDEVMSVLLANPFDGRKLILSTLEHH